MRIDHHALPPAVHEKSSIEQKTNADLGLVALIACGDKVAMQVFFSRHKIRVYRFALHLTNDEVAAEDLMIEVLLSVWRDAKKLEKRSDVVTWMLTMTRQLALSFLRRRAIEGLGDAGASPIDGVVGDPEIALRKKQQHSIIASCLNRLSPADREIIDLVYCHGRSVSEVAEITGLPRHTVKTRMFYARNEMTKLLKTSAIETGGLSTGVDSPEYLVFWQPDPPYVLQ